MIKSGIVILILVVCGFLLVAAPPVIRLFRVLLFGPPGRGKTASDDSVTCLRCGYDLRGLDTPRCPECSTLRGFKVPMEDLGLSEEDIRKAKADQRSMPSND